jgi:phosphoserine phosphatase RsbU/P
MRRNVLITFLAVLALAPQAARAQFASSLQPIVRYHYGDNLAWASPSFDDSSWPVAVDGRVPATAFESDGVVWIRARIAVPADISGPFAIEANASRNAPDVEDIFVNGARAGAWGEFPPHAQPLLPPPMLVFDLPSGMVHPGRTVMVAMRGWTLPADRGRATPEGPHQWIVPSFSIQNASLLHAISGEARATAWLRFAPQLSISLMFILMGAGVLALGVWARRRDLQLGAIWLVLTPAFLIATGLDSPLLAGVHLRVFMDFFVAIDLVVMWVALEFLWAVQGFRARLARAAAYVCWIAFHVAIFIGFHLTYPGALAATCVFLSTWMLFAFNVITGGANLAAVLGRGRNPAIAVPMLLINVGYFLRNAGVPVYFGSLPLNFFDAAYYLSTLAIAILLLYQGSVEWRKGNELRIEFASAREVQQRLVPAALPAIGRFRFAAAYLPAAEVGGDFYQVLAQRDGSALIVVGDVSGKGLKAAMTGTLVLGAFRSLTQEELPPAQILSRLNAQLAAASDGGFVTCLCARVGRDGVMTVANAGHLAPYRNGEEVAVDSGFPLGMIAGTYYTETTLSLTPGDRLTFLSDGVAEARNGAGELFGFERTAAISKQSAEAIAQAAQAHGQEDDITVLTLTFAPAEVLHA